MRWTFRRQILVPFAILLVGVIALTSAIAATLAVQRLKAERAEHSREVAEAIHRHSARSEGPFLPIHLAALSPQVIESELFGHVRGAFTGADRDRPGLLQQAEGGTVFLDEIGDVPAAVQVKLLRVIERKELTPVGDPRPRPGNFRLIAATHRSLPELVSRGEFRADLLFRLSAFQIDLPPLRERREDLPVLARHLLSRISGKPYPGEITAAFEEELGRRNWVGNVRELLQALETASIMAREGELRPEHLPKPIVTDRPRGESFGVGIALRGSLKEWLEGALAGGVEGTEKGLYAKLLDEIEPVLFKAVLEACQGQRGKAAELLGIHRGTLRDKLRQHGMDVE